MRGVSDHAASGSAYEAEARLFIRGFCSRHGTKPEFPLVFAHLRKFAVAQADQERFQGIREALKVRISSLLKSWPDAV